MAPRDRKGKAADRSTTSTMWSDPIWDQRGFWYRTRTSSAGEPEYDYLNLEGTQTSAQQQTIPRFPGPNIITSSNNYDSPSVSPSGVAYTTQPNSDYISTASTSPAYGSIPQYGDADTSPHHYNTTPLYYAPSSATQSQDTAHGTSLESACGPARPDSSGSNASTVRWASTSAADTLPRASQRTDYYTAMSPQSETLTLSTNFEALSMSPPSTASEQAYGTSPPQQDWYDDPSLPSSSAELDARYRVISKGKERSFWRVGRVFMALWTEPARDGLARDMSYGAQGGGSTYSKVSDVYLNGKAFTEIRRFVIVGEGWGSSICSPIHTYNGQATLKPNLPECQQHAIIYTSDKPPDEYWYTTASGDEVRENLQKDPIKVKSEQSGPDGDLGDKSRLNYSKIYTVEHYVRVRNIGMVDKSSIEALKKSSFVKPRESPEKPRKHPPRNDPKGGDSKGKTKWRDTKDNRDTRDIRDTRDTRERERKHTHH